MSKRENEIAYFVSFCVELYKTRHSISGGEAFDLFNQYGVTGYLSNNFDVLHSQGHNWLISDIDNFILKRREAGR